MTQQNLTPYLTQLQKKAKRLKLNLADVCKAEGVAVTTLWRWRKNHTTCRFGTADALYRRMDLMAEKRGGDK